jgi:protein involved in polysaccharide export with SLBB domain
MKASMSFYTSIILLAACLSGCENPTALPPLEGGALEAFIDSSRSAQQLQAADKIKIVVYDEDRLSGDFQVDRSGYLSAPLIGNIKVSGLTKVELERKLEKSFSAVVKNPKVSVEFLSVRPLLISGEVKNPGRYDYGTGLNVMSALALAGGQSYRASRDRVLIQHAGESSLREYPMAVEIPVMPGDFIYVPQRYF